MESTVSVSKGVFLFRNGINKSKPKKKGTLYEKIFKNEPWYLTYKNNWECVEREIKQLHQKTYSILLNDIVNYVKSFHGENYSEGFDGVIPSATLLTGVNQPDHASQFTALIQSLREDVTPHIAMVHSQDASTLKHLVENVVWQLIHGCDALDYEDEDTESMKQHRKLRKNQCTMKVLQHWYQSAYSNISPKKNKYMFSNKLLVIIIPDFESFNCSILQDFVMIISTYVSSLPIVFVFGVATSVSALHKSFPYHVSSKLLIKVFHSHSSPVYMNQVLEDIFLSHLSPFHLSGKAFELLTDVFLFYDFSVTGLIQSIKYCMMEHYYGDNIKSLCCGRSDLEKAIMKLTPDDIENVRHLMSFRPFVEAQLDSQTKIALLEDDYFFTEVLLKEMYKLNDYLYTFYMCVRLLLVFIRDIPKNILGKSVREIYTKCAAEHIPSTPAFRECITIIKFQSQVKLVEAIKNALKIVNSTLQFASPTKPFRSTPTKNNLNNIVLNNELGESFAKAVRVHLVIFLRQIENANTEASVFTRDVEDDFENVPGNRYKLKEQLLNATRTERIQSGFDMIRFRFVSYLEEMFNRGLQPPHTQTFHEILFFSDVANVKKQIIGSPRGALHTALSNPVHYLQCECCASVSAEGVSESLPDICLAYKLHRECGKLINLYDWLQAFAAVLRPDDENDPKQDATVQVRFTRAVAELQFLGFIKSSKRKTDHVMRLTW